MNYCFVAASLPDPALRRKIAAASIVSSVVGVQIEGDVMKGFKAIRFVPWLVLAVVLWLASAAYGKGGATVRTYAPPPLDAGSAVANPDYLPKVTPTTGQGFDWADAGIGAAAALGGFIVVATGSTVVLRSRRRNLAAT